MDNKLQIQIVQNLVPVLTADIKIGGASGDYLPLSGGEMTGRIDFNPAAGTASSNKALISAQTADGLKALFGAKTDENGILRDVAVIPKLQGDLVSYETILTSFIGNINTPVTRIHAKKITSSGITDAITIPPNAGTMARLEDLTGDKISITFAGQADTVQNAIDTLKTDQGDLGEQVSTIESKIPADASETNPLVTKNEVLALPTFTYKVVTELPETGEENIIYLVPKAGEGNDVHDEYIWVNGGYELIGSTAVDLSGYLQTTGGTMTGSINYELGELKDYNWKNAPLLIATFSAPGNILSHKNVGIYATANGLAIGAVKEDSPLISFLFNEYVEPGHRNAKLGSVSTPWYYIATNKIATGIDTTDYSTNVINIPNKKGTLARMEDIDAAVGDISTALTAILGE